MSPIWYIVIALSSIIVVHPELICPGFGFIRPQQPCINQCSPDNDTCAAGQKCCYTPVSPCGYRCLVGKNNVKKPGNCPSTESEQNFTNWYLCDGHFCDVDRDCRCKKKCCRNKCGTPLCILPQ